MATLTIPTSLTLISGVIFDTVSVAAHTPGKIYTLDANGDAVLADNTTAALSTTYPLYVSLTNGAAGQPISLIATNSTIDVTGVTPDPTGKVYALDGTAGTLTELSDLTTGEYVTICAYGTSSTTLVFNVNATGRTAP